MQTLQYTFVNLHISDWVKYILFGIVIGFIFFLFLRTPIWITPLIVICFCAGAYLSKSGSISINYIIKKPTIVIKDSNRTITIGTPIQANVWWNYSFKPNYDELEFNDGSQRSGAKASDINVMLESTKIKRHKK